MRLAAIGVGGTGCRVVAALQDAEPDDRPYLTGVAALDTDATALAELPLPADHRVRFGALETDGEGAGGDRELGREAAAADVKTLSGAVDDAVTAETDAILFVAGVGGGTGAGATPEVAADVDDLYGLPLYAVSVLPESDAAEVATANATAATDALAETVDAQLLFDVETQLRAGETPPSATGEEADATRRRLNASVADGVEALFAAGELRPDGHVGERVVDATEIVNTLAAGPYATLSHHGETVREPPSWLDRALASAPVSFLERFSSVADDPVDELDAIKTFETNSRRALVDRSWSEYDHSSTARALAVFGGPPGWLRGKAVENVATWLEGEFEGADVRSGDAPTPYGTDVTITVLAAGIGRPPRFETAARRSVGPDAGE